MLGQWAASAAESVRAPTGGCTVYVESDLCICSCIIVTVIVILIKPCVFVDLFLGAEGVA